MDIESINKQIQAENNSFNRNLNRLQQELLNLKQRHQRRITDLQKQKEQAKSQHIITNEKFKLKSKTKIILECIEKFC